MKNKSKKHYFSAAEIILWSVSVALIIASFCLFDIKNYLNFVATLLGVTALILNAKGNPIGQVLMIVFGIAYGIISYSFTYYGETITYVGMSVPMAAVSLVSWLKNPFNGNKSEVKVNKISRKETIFMFALTAVVTVAFYFILRCFGTANLIFSTISVTTSFMAAYLTLRRSAYYAIAYAANDVVLIVLWVLASTVDLTYLSVVVCFFVFLANDLYAFFNWKKTEKAQKDFLEQSQKNKA